MTLARPGVHDAVTVHAVDGEDNIYEGNAKLERVGKDAPLAFGGCVVAQCISAAFASLPASSTIDDPFQLYSALGHFLSPGDTEVTTRYHVEDIRTTRSFATRKVEAWQEQSASTLGRDKAATSKRRIIVVLLDFQKAEKRSIMEYNILPLYADEKKTDFKSAVEEHYSSPTTLDLTKEYIGKNYDAFTAEVYARWFSLPDRFYETKIISRCFTGQTAYAIAGERETEEDHLPITKRTHSTWARLKTGVAASQQKVPLPKVAGLQEAALAFFMDVALAFIPLNFSRGNLHQISMCSSLDFSLRFFNHPVDMNDWILQEQTTELGNAGKTSSTGRVWNREGKLIASMTQLV